LLTHYNRITAYDAFFQDDIKVNAKLTVNVGVRWEYDGWPSDKIGQFSDIWASQLALVNTGSFFLSQPLSCQASPTAAFQPVGTLAGFVVPKNFDRTAGFTGPCGSSGVLLNGNDTLFPGSPLDNFMPRLGIAWQPFGHKFVVRAGYGWFYDRAGSIYLVDNLLQEPPYSGPITGTSITNLENTLHTPFQAVAGIPLSWTPRYMSACASQEPGGCGFNFDLNAYNFFGSLDYSGLALGTNSPDMSKRLPLTQQYNLDLQYDLGRGWVVDVGYVGSHSTHVLNQGTSINVAHLVGSSGSLLCGGATGDCSPQDLSMFNNPNFRGGNPIPFNDPANPTPVTVNTTQNAPARVSYLGFTPGALGTTNTVGDALFNSLQAQVRHNFSHGMLLQASYTWGKALTNVNSAEPGLLDVGQNDFGTTGSNDPLNLRQQWGPNSGYRTQRLIVSYTYALPWHATAGLSGHLLSGWSISGITTLQNGQALTVTDTGGGTIYGGTGSRALLADPTNCITRGAKAGICNSGISVGTSGSTTQRVLSDLPGSPGYNASGTGGWINFNAFTAFSTITASSPFCIGGVPNTLNITGGSPDATCGAAPSAFAPPGSPGALGATNLIAGTGWGDSPVGIITGPGQWNWDLSIQKNTKVTEWGTLQFRTEFFNIWNHPQFSNPVSTVYTGAPFGTFGQIQSTSVEPRVIQFALKFLF